MGISCIRSIPGDGEERLKCYGTDDIYEIVRLLSDTKVDTVLIDTRDGSNASYGGRGILSCGIDMAEIRAVLHRKGKNLMLGGGIDPGNISRVVSEYAPDTVDIVTGAEGENGEKISLRNCPTVSYEKS